MPSYGPGERPGVQSTYGTGLGNIYQFGAQNPFGPYAGLNRAPGVGGTGSSTTTSGSAGPTDAASAFFNEVLSGKKLPYDQSTQDSLYSTASDMSAAAEGANLQQATAAAQRGGASANDPSLQGQHLALQGQRQAANMKSKQDISNKSNIANFGAQEDAANALQQANFEQQRINQGNMNSLMPYSRGGGGKGGNNFGGSGGDQGFLQFHNANINDYRRPQSASVSDGSYLSQAGQDYRHTQAWQDDYNRSMKNDQYYEDMGL
jgi:hypothetical protein